MRLKKNPVIAITNMNDLSGKRFGRWLVLRFSKRGYSNRFVWTCVCDCGKERDVFGPNLTSGKSKSCGCLMKEMISLKSTTHGATRGGVRKTEYTIHNKIKGRCFNPNDAAYWMYGARGITLCDGWLKFENFLADIGPRPSNKSVDRKDNNLGYTCGKCPQCVSKGWPMNCHWATAKQQCNNRRTTRFLEIKGVKKSMSEWAEVFGVSPQLVWSRLANGYTPAMLGEKYLK